MQTRRSTNFGTCSGMRSRLFVNFTRGDLGNHDSATVGISRAFLAIRANRQSVLLRRYCCNSVSKGWLTISV